MVPFSYSYKTCYQIKHYDEVLHVHNHGRQMAFKTKNIADRGFGIEGMIRKLAIANIDLRRPHDEICESINRINDLNWVRKEPIYFSDQSIKYFKKLAELGRPTNHLDIEEQRFIDFVGAQKLDLYYKVSTYEYKREYIYTPSSTSTSDPSTWPGPKQIDRLTPLFTCFNGLPPSSMLHRLYLHCRLHFYNEQVAKYLFWDRDKKDPYSPHDNRIYVHNKAVKHL